MLTGLFRTLRPHQWVKNLFVLAPLVFAQKLNAPTQLKQGILALLAFCLASSAVYIFNDYRDRVEDGNHPLKQHRPIASGQLPVSLALSALTFMLFAATGIALTLGYRFLTAISIYLAINFMYTIALKSIVILDVMIIAAGFVLRVLAGGFAVRVEVSAWLLLCTSFLSLLLAFSKRRHELVLLSDEAASQRQVLSHYSLKFLDQMINVVTASTVVAYAVYAISPETAQRFDTEYLILTMPFVLFGIFRYLYLVYQKPDTANPTEAILRDSPFLANLALWGIAVLWIVYGL
jgi:4-hydroxybenzoate polyprenyltransferase